MGSTSTHQMRDGAVRRAGTRFAWEASHQMAMSRHAVFPRPVGTPTWAGHTSLAATWSARGGLKLVHATLIRAADNWQRVGITATERAQLNLLYQELEIQPVNQMSAVA